MAARMNDPQYNVAIKASMLFLLAVLCFVSGRITSGQLVAPAVLGWLIPVPALYLAMLALPHDWTQR